MQEIIKDAITRRRVSAIWSLERKERTGGRVGKKLKRTEGQPIPPLPKELAERIILEALPRLEGHFDESE